jgi:hypothetical protein
MNKKKRKSKLEFVSHDLRSKNNDLNYKNKKNQIKEDSKDIFDQFVSLESDYKSNKETEEVSKNTEKNYDIAGMFSPIMKNNKSVLKEKTGLLPKR